MKYTAILDGKERHLEVTPLGQHLFRVSVDGILHEVDARDSRSDVLSILIDHVSHDISYAMAEPAIELNFRNRYFNIEVLDERRMRMRHVRAELDISGPEIIKTSMPGRIVQVLVKLGQKVKPGEGIIIMEAMKMENEIRCRNRGSVKKIHVTTGQTVAGGLKLVEIDPIDN